MAREYIDLDSGEITQAIEDSMNNMNSQRIEFIDASSEMAKVLIPQMGSDLQFTKGGNVDTRRFTNIKKTDAMWLSYFENIPDEYGGKYAHSFCEMFRNHNYSVNGEHKKLLVDMQRAVSGLKEEDQKSKKRGWFDRLLGRNKDE